MKIEAVRMKFILIVLSLVFCSQLAWSQAKVMNPGEAYGQLIYLSIDDVVSNSPKFQSLYPLSIPVFAELPTDLSVVAGAITLKQQNLLSHVQLKSTARHTPNLDISELPGGLTNELMKPFVDGDWAHMLLGKDGSIQLTKSTEQAAIDFDARNKKNLEPVKLKSDLTAQKIFKTSELGWQDFEKVGSKAANYAELAKALNSATHVVVRPGFAIPFYYYQEFLDSNPAIKMAIEQVVRDPLISKAAKVAYREQKLKNLRDMILAPTNVVSQSLLEDLLVNFDTLKNPQGLPRKLKLRSSTNSEDLPNFNGAGLYESAGYKPTDKNPQTKVETEKTKIQKEEALKQTLRTVWASVWTRRAFEERVLFNIPHADVKMAMQVNLAFDNEGCSGVVVTRNILSNTITDEKLKGPAVYIESQRGDKYTVTNPASEVKPEKILVLFDKSQPLNKAAYEIHIIQKSNVDDSGENILPQDNPKPTMSDDEISDLAFQVLKAESHFKPFLGANNPNFALDLEFKVDSEDTKMRQIYLKQARPYIDPYSN